MPRAHPKNVEGPFYVEDGCCLICAVPFDAAPGMLSFTEAGDHCFVSRQPATDAEVDLMLEASANAEAQCIRYRGDAARIVRALARRGDARLWDPPAPQRHAADGATLALRAPLPIAEAPFARHLAHRCCAVQMWLRVRPDDGPPWGADVSTVERWAPPRWVPAFTLRAEVVDSAGRLHVQLEPGGGSIEEVVGILLAALQEEGGFPGATWVEAPPLP